MNLPSPVPLRNIVHANALASRYSLDALASHPGGDQVCPDHYFTCFLWRCFALVAGGPEFQNLVTPLGSSAPAGTCASLISCPLHLHRQMTVDNRKEIRWRHGALLPRVFLRRSRLAQRLGSVLLSPLAGNKAGTCLPQGLILELLCPLAGDAAWWEWGELKIQMALHDWS